jgi:hypothetical protein
VEKESCDEDSNLECTLIVLYTAGAMNGLVKEMNNYKADICALQEIGRHGTGNVI